MKRNTLLRLKRGGVRRRRKNEVIVGAVFNAAVAGYRLTGANPFGI